MSDSVKYIKYNGGVEASAFTKTNGTANDVLLADGTTIAISDLLSDYYTKDEADELHTSVIKIKGTIGGKEGSISALPTDAEIGDAYIVDSDALSSYGGHSVESGDIFVWIKRGDRGYWTVIQSNWTASSGSSDLSWGSNTTLATVGGVNINAKLPTNPVDDLEIGGVNLLPNTRTGVGFTFQPLSTGCSGEFDSTNKWFKFTCPQNAVTTSLADTILLKSPTVLLTPGTYTVSCLYRCTLPLNRMQVLCLPVTSEGSYDMNTLSFAFEVKSSNPVTYFKKYSATFTISEDLRDVYGWIIRIDLDHRGSHGGNQELYVKDIKLEKGHKATDWTPTLEGEYLPLSGGKMLGHIDMLGSSIIWNDWDSSIGLLNGQLVITGGEGLVFNGATALFAGDIIPADGSQNIGYPDKLFDELYINKIIPEEGIFYNDLVDDGRAFITVNEQPVFYTNIDDSGMRKFFLGSPDQEDCFNINVDFLDIYCTAGGTNIYGYLSILNSNEGPYASLSINSEGALEITNSTDIQGGLRSTASAEYSNVLLGVNNPSANETGFTDMGTDIMANGYPLVISTVDNNDGTCLVFGPGDIYALRKNSEGTGYLSSTLFLQHREDYYGDVLIGRNLQVGDINGYGGTGGNLTVKGYAEAKDGFKKTGFTNDYVLLAGGDAKHLSEIAAPSPVNEKFKGFVTNSVTLSKDQTRKIDEYWIVGADFTPTFLDSNTQNTSTSDPLYVGDIVYVKQATGRPIENDATFEDVYGIIRYSSLYLPLTGTRDGLPLSGSIAVGNWVEKVLDAADAFIHLKFNAEEEASIINASFPYVPILAYSDSNGQFNSLIEICFADNKFDKPKISFAHGICPGEFNSDIGHPDDAFRFVYASLFKGVADNALKLCEYDIKSTPTAINIGNASTPVYFKDGVPVACNSIPTSSTIAGWGYVTTSGITQLNVGTGLQGKANNGDSTNAITSSIGTISLKTASKNEIGGIRIGYTKQSDNLYPIELNNKGQAYVTVPWTDSKVTQSRSTSNGAYPLLCKYDTTNDSTTNSVNFVSGVTVNPSTGAVNAQAFYETSDIRKKEIKSDLSLDKCYDLIDKCQTVIYSLKDQTKELVGMIAQEIEEFFPEVVATDEEGFKSLAYDRLVVICFKVLKDVIKRLEKLETK